MQPFPCVRLIQERDEARNALADAERLVKEAGGRKRLEDEELENQAKRVRHNLDVVLCHYSGCLAYIFLDVWNCLSSCGDMCFVPNCTIPGIWKSYPLRFGPEDVVFNEGTTWYPS